jgi:secreted trypsin-like serine protease
LKTKNLSNLIYRVFLITIACHILIACNKTTKLQIKNSHPIVGGEILQKEDPLFCYVVLIQNENKNPSDISYCSGVLISGRYILTAAHCISTIEGSVGRIAFPLSESVLRFNNNQIKIHKNYTPENLKGDYERLRDIAIIRLNDDPPFPYKSLALSPAGLQYPPEFFAKVVGYGAKQGSILKKEVQDLTLKFATLKINEFNFESPYFEAQQRQSGICFGDSGGPVIIGNEQENFLIGLSVDVLFNPTRIFEPFYDRCLEKAVFLNLVYFQTWIEDSIRTF